MRLTTPMTSCSLFIDLLDHSPYYRVYTEQFVPLWRMRCQCASGRQKLGSLRYSCHIRDIWICLRLRRPGPTSRQDGEAGSNQTSSSFVFVYYICIQIRLTSSLNLQYQRLDPQITLRRPIFIGWYGTDIASQANTILFPVKIAYNLE